MTDATKPAATAEVIDWHRVRLKNLIADLERDLGIDGAHEVGMYLVAALMALDRKAKEAK